ncbi:autotransporter outer membrane beta-barrel domain-containing protein, partial [Moraxella oblonga]|uniref:autotransporter outer membrane beta-barrel domain-containing protein n=1 Tax=Moraxella oblonga TaxID=200413 RepID=UPI000AE7EA17
GTNIGTNTTPPKQADYISRYTNTALSTLSSQMHSVMQINRGLDSHLLGIRPTDLKFGKHFWVNADRSHETVHHSDNHRQYKKDESLKQVGFDAVLDDTNVAVGGALSHTQSNQQFADRIKAEGDTHMVSVYARTQMGKRFFTITDASYGKGKNVITSAGEQATTHQNVKSVGLSAGMNIETPVVDIQPSVGVRYHHLSSTHYHMNGASAYISDVDLVSYKVGVALEKTMPLSNGLTIKPSIASYYVDSKDKQGQVTMNGKHKFTQEFGSYGYHEAKLSIGQKSWETAVSATIADGSEVDKRSSVGLKFNYKW